MSKHRKSKRNRPSAPPRAAGRSLARVYAVVVAVALVAGAVFWWVKLRQPDASPAGPDSAVSATNPAAPTAANPTFDQLKGKWLRPDGGYVLDIRGVEASGKLDATYANPKPIHVERAAAVQEGATTKVFIELRDVNYPGSTYTLAYDQGSDQLAGIYYQAAMQQRFEVVFERMK